jgi:hypothetical protein
MRLGSLESWLVCTGRYVEVERTWWYAPACERLTAATTRKVSAVAAINR